MANPLRIVFMGTPDFAVPSLQALHDSRFTVIEVVTQPDRPKGRGRKLQPPPVKTAAQKLGYPVLQPEYPRTQSFADHLSETNPDLFVVIAFGHILPRKLLDIPRLGAVNIHASLLPRYRGPAPIHRAVINRETESGITAIQMDTGMDTGDMLVKERLEITSEETTGTLHDRLANLGAEVLIRTVSDIEADDLHPVSQDDRLATYAPPLQSKDGHIDWSKPAEELDAFIRGMNPWPGAFTFWGKKRLKVFKGKPLSIDPAEKPGTVLPGFPDELRVATGKGVLSLLELQGPSGKRLSIDDFLRGHPISPGTLLT
ncbi:MAG: methionyl-tRNA formyltransferase [Thermodesulfobacteriota bacterium]